MRSYITGPCLILLFVLGGCRAWWEQKVAFPSPSADAVLRIEQPFPANGWGTRVILQGRSGSKVLYQIRGDVFLDFVDVAWSPKGDAVGVFTCGTPALRIAYDVGNGREYRFAQMERLIVEHIRSRYLLGKTSLTAREVLEWACSSEGKTAFLHAYPSAAPR